MIAAILPLLYVERGAQMTFVLQSVPPARVGRLLLGRRPARLDAGPLAAVARDVRPRRRPARPHRRGRCRRAGPRRRGRSSSWASSSSRSASGRSAAPSATPSGPASSRGSADDRRRHRSGCVRLDGRHLDRVRRPRGRRLRAGARRGGGPRLVHRPDRRRRTPGQRHGPLPVRRRRRSGRLPGGRRLGRGRGSR